MLHNLKRGDPWAASFRIYWVLFGGGFDPYGVANLTGTLPSEGAHLAFLHLPRSTFAAKWYLGRTAFET